MSDQEGLVAHSKEFYSKCNQKLLVLFKKSCNMAQFMF